MLRYFKLYFLNGYFQDARKYFPDWINDIQATQKKMLWWIIKAIGAQIFLCWKILGCLRKMRISKKKNIQKWTLRQHSLTLTG